MTAKVSINPAILPSNEFVSHFSRAVQGCGYAVGDVRWGLRDLVRSDVVIMHWPNAFFRPGQQRYARRLLLKMTIARRLFGTKFIWVAHNVLPHDADLSSLNAQRFVDRLAGIIHLSETGRDILNANYRIPAHVRQLVTVHGAYEAETAASMPLKLRSTDPVRAITFGLIKPYKNIEAVIAASAAIGPDAVQLSVVGKAAERNYAQSLRQIAGTNVRLDARDGILANAELETMVDESDLVVLPYRRILNSGAVFFGLSRNRPVVAPNTGALPELRRCVGEHWLYLFDGEFTEAVLRDAIDWARNTPRDVPPHLESYSWTRVQHDLRTYLSAMLTDD